MKVWPEFHNGVAAGLRLPQCIDKNAKSMGEIERSWIVYNKPSKTSQDDSQTNSAHHQSQQPSRHAHGGFLMALGLRGYLTALSMPDVIDYLTKGSVTIAVGVLLGMSANKRGTCDLSVSKMLCLHIPSLFPTSFSSIDVASESQIAAVTGIGLLYQKSSHRLMTEFLLNEIGKRPTNEQNIHDRESYSLSCGIALGMVNLCLRNKEIPTNVSVVDDLSDLQIEERLLRYIVGGLDENHLHHQKGASSISSSAPGVESERCSRIHEGDMVNIDVTAPGAILALGMIYLKSG
jgi:anaphase-promoting complex subunit 1